MQLHYLKHLPNIHVRFAPLNYMILLLNKTCWALKFEWGFLFTTFWHFFIKLQTENIIQQIYSRIKTVQKSNASVGTLCSYHRSNFTACIFGLFGNYKVCVRNWNNLIMTPCDTHVWYRTEQVYNISAK